MSGRLIVAIVTTLHRERIDVGEEVTLVGQKRLKLIVRRDSGKSRETK